MIPGLELLLLYVGGALGISFLCSLLESGLLSVRDSQLAAKASQGHANAKVLLHIKQERIDDAISAILTLNTIAHTIGATLAGAQATVVFGDAWVGIFSGVLTLLVLVLTEIIPKTIGATYAGFLIGFVARVTSALMMGLAPVLFLTRWITRLLTPPEQPSVTPVEISALVGIAASQGTVQQEHQRFFDNVLTLEDVRVCDVMTPHTVTARLAASATLREFIAAKAERTFSRIPLYGKSRDDAVGYIIQRHVLNAIVSGADLDTPLSEYKRNAWFVPETAKITDTWRQFVGRHQHLAIVVDEYGALAGVLTLEDVIETILGVEIVDETDRTADLRTVAARLRDERLSNITRQQDRPS